LEATVGGQSDLGAFLLNSDVILDEIAGVTRQELRGRNQHNQPTVTAIRSPGPFLAFTGQVRPAERFGPSAPAFAG
jgi:hypothetical protein